MIGDPTAVPTLIAALEANNTPVAAANAIARIGDERGVVPIIDAAGDPQKRLWMVMALGELGSPLALPWLQAAAADEQSSVRQAAQEAQWKITQLSASRPVAALAGVLAGDASASHRMWAAFRLGELNQAAAIPVLMQALEDDNRDVRGRAAAALIRIGDATLPVLRARIQDGSGAARLYAVAILGYIGSLAELPLLQAVAGEGQSDSLADTARRSIDLIGRFSRPDDGFTDFEAI
jgi:HEAT repeat protein